MSNEIPVTTTDDSTIPALDTNEFEAPNPDQSIDAMFEDYLAATGQDEEIGTEVEEVEVSEEDEEQPLSDDDTPDVEQSDDADDAAEETAQGVDYNDVSYQELKEGNFRVPIKGKNGEIKYYDIDQINAEVNRARSQDDARNEVETARSEFEAQKASFEQDQYAFEQSRIAAIGAQQMQALQAQGQQLQEQYNEAATAGNAQEAIRIQAQINQLNQKYGQIQTQVQEAQTSVDNARNEAAGRAAEELVNYGMGDLASDPQRVEAFKEYAMANIPSSLVGVVNTNAALLAMVEKARLYDKAHSEKPKAKLKGSNKTLKGRAAKPAPKAKQVDRVQSTIDSMFS